MSARSVGGLEPRPKQLAFYAACSDPDADMVLFDGAIRSGKSQACCRQLVAWAFTFPGQYLVGRKTYRELEDTTKKVMLEGEGGCPPAIPRELIAEESKSDNQVRLLNNSLIMFRSLEEPAETASEKIRNLTLAGAFVDQIEELDDDGYEDMLETLLGRLSSPGGPNKLLAASNPGPETHWLYRLAVDPLTRDEDVRYVHATLFDNDTLSPDYVRRMRKREKTNRPWFDQFVLGQWGAFGGKRFGSVWDRRHHVLPAFPVPDWWEWTEAIDYGWSHPLCVLWHAKAPCGHEYVVYEHYEAERTVSHHVERIKEVRKMLKCSPEETWLDPSAWAPRGEYESPAFEFEERGIECGKAQNDRLGGWNAIEEALSRQVRHRRDDDDTAYGRADSPQVQCCPGGPGPQLRIFSRCTNLVRELPSLRIKEGSDDVEKKNDDAPDALRYLLMSRPKTPEEPEVPDEQTARGRAALRRARRRAQGARSSVYVG